MDTPRFFVRPDTIRRALYRNHLTHQAFADHLGLSRAYWSQIFRGHRHLTPTMRQIPLASHYLAGVPEDALWTVAHESG